MSGGEYKKEKFMSESEEKDPMNRITILQKSNVYYYDAYCRECRDNNVNCEIKIRCFLFSDVFLNYYVRIEVERENHKYGAIQTFFTKKETAEYLFKEISSHFCNEKSQKDIKREIINIVRNTADSERAIYDDTLAINGFFFKKHKDGDQRRKGDN